MTWLIVILGMSSAGIPTTITPVPIGDAEQCGAYIPVGRQGFCMTVQDGRLVVTDIMPKN